MKRTGKKRTRRKKPVPVVVVEDSSSEEEIQDASDSDDDSHPSLAKLRSLFKPPTAKEIQQAIGEIDPMHPFDAQDYWFDPAEDFDPVPLPNHRDDYLAQVKQ